MREPVKQFIKTLGVVILSIALSIGALQLLFGGAASRDRAVQRAQLCTLVLPNPPETGRDEGRFNRVCMVNNGLDPFDVNGDGNIEVDP